VLDIAQLVEEAAVAEGVLDPERVADQITLAEDEDERRFAYLLGLDRALAVVHPHFDAVDRGRLLDVAVRYRMTGRLNAEAAAGALLPRVATPQRLQILEDPPTEALADLFNALTVVSAATWR
jgi:hypothetical protein